MAARRENQDVEEAIRAEKKDFKALLQLTLHHLICYSGITRRENSCNSCSKKYPKNTLEEVYSVVGLQLIELLDSVHDPEWTPSRMSTYN